MENQSLRNSYRDSVLISSLATQIEGTLEQRTILNKFFNGWLEMHNKEKEKWNNLVKYKYLVGRIKLNKVFWAWKLQIRQMKVQRLKESIISHQIYKLNLRNCFKSWKNEYLRMKEGTRILGKVCDKRMKMLIFKYLEFKNKDYWDKEHQLYLAAKFLNKKIQQRNYKLLQIAVRNKKRTKNNKLKADELRRYQIKRKYYQAILEFSKMQNKKLETIKQVNDYLNQKYRMKILQMLKVNANENVHKDVSVRKAMQFQVFRHKFYQQKLYFRILKTWKNQDNAKKNEQAKKIYLFRLRRFFDLFAKALKIYEDDELVMVRQYQGQLMRIKYFSMWKKTLQTKARENRKNNEAMKLHDMRVCKRIMQEMKQTINRQRELKQKSEQVKRTVEQRILGTVLKRLSEVKQVKEMRVKMMGDFFNNKARQLKSLGLQKIKNYSFQEFRNQQIMNLRRVILLQKSIKALRQYLQSKSKQAIDYKMARKFRYMRILQKGFNTFRNYLESRKDLQVKKLQAQKLNQKLTIQKAWSQFKVINNIVNFKNIRAQKLYNRRNQKKLRICFEALNRYTQDRQAKRQKAALSILFHDNHLLKSYFNEFKNNIMKLINARRQLNFKETKIQRIHEKVQKQQIFKKLKLNRKESITSRQIVNNAKEQINLVKKKHAIQRMIIFTKLSQDQRQKQMKAYLFHQRICFLKTLFMLKKNVKHQKQKKLRKFKILKIWAKKSLRKVFIGLKGYTEYSKEKKLVYSAAFDQRKRVQIQQILYKFCRVANYWLTSKESNREYNEVKMKKAFLKWRYISFREFRKSHNTSRYNDSIKLAIVNDSNSNIFEQRRTGDNYAFSFQNNMQQQPVKEEKVLNNQPIRNMTQTQKQPEILEWLSNFDKGNARNNNQSQMQQSSQKSIMTSNTQINNYLDKKREDLDHKHRLKLKEFDNFLSTMQTTATKTVTQNNPKMTATSTQRMNMNQQFQSSNMPQSIQKPQYNPSVYQQTQQLNFTNQYDNTPTRLLSELMTPVKPASQHINTYDYPNYVQTNSTMRDNRNENSQRIQYIQREIQQFLKDKELLRQLEASDNRSAASTLLKDEIKSKSNTIQSLCEELNYLKKAIY